MARGKKAAAIAGQAKLAGAPPRRCGLCGKAKRLMRTECCGNWICDDEASYQLFSYARNSCSRNHRRYTLCGNHSAEGHDGAWQECAKCRGDFETEMYVYYGTNEYNFTMLANPPSFEPTLCSRCGRRIVLGDGGYTRRGNGYTCMDCAPDELQRLMRGTDRGKDAGA